MSDVFTVFYCWQSDTPRRHGRDLVREALEAAADRISTDQSVPYRVAVHADTENEPGLCNIPDTILRRLREADAVVSDLTFIAITDDRSKHCSNPNVLFELGYAFKAIGPERLICVMNEAHGPRASQIFDLAHHRRPIPFTSPNNAAERSRTIEGLSVELEDALRAVLRYGHSSPSGGDDELMHQRQLSEVESYWRSISSEKQREPIVSLVFRPMLYQQRRWADAQAVEAAVRDCGVRDARDRAYPPQQKGNAPMNWGLYNDTYGDPWAITYAGQFWTEIDIGAYGPLQLSQRDASVSPEPPATPRLLDKQWILAPQALSDIRTTFQFMGNLCAEFGGGEAVQWSLEASKLNGKWISFGRQASAMGPSKAPSIRRDGDMPADGFTSDWSDVYIDFAKDLCDAFCRDGRVVTREALAALCEAAGT